MLKFTKKMKYIFVTLWLFSSFFSFSQNEEIILKRFKNFADSNVFDLIYLHTDKDEYNINQNLWFTAYIIDSKINKPDTLKQILFVELISFEKEIVYTKKYFVNNKGFCSGNFFLPDSLPRGYYQIRAFTNSMKNYKFQQFFKKTIFINNSFTKISAEYFKILKKNKKQSYFVDFKINNKYLIDGQTTRIYYYPIFFNTKDLNHRISLTDNKGEIIYKNDCVSPGYFNFIPQKANKYFLTYYNNKKKHKIKLDKVINYGLTANITEMKNSFEVKLTKSQITKDLIAKKYFIVIEKTGNISSINTVIVDTSTTLKISKKQLPNGISFVHILNSNYQEIEVLPIYKKDESQAKFDIASFIKNDTLYIEITNKNKLNANFSISITNQNSTFPSIENYLNFFAFSVFPDKISDTLLDENTRKECLLNVYTRNIYSFDSIIDQKRNYYLFKPVFNNSVKGFINLILEKIPSKNSYLQMTILNSYNDKFTTSTDKNGKFVFDSLNYDDSVEFHIKAKSKNNKDIVGITIFPYDTNTIFFEPTFFTKDLKLNRKNIKKEATNYRNKSKSMYGLHPDQIISGKDIVNSGTNNVLDALKGRVTGYYKQGNLVTFRGPKTIMGNKEPLYLIDDIPVDVEAVQSINVNDIESVEIIRSAYGGAMYGLNGANGIIAIYTKKGHKIQWGEFHGKITGISKPKKFIETKYEEKNHTYEWISNANISSSENKKTLKIKINKKGMININVQGISTNGNFITYKNIIL